MNKILLILIASMFFGCLPKDSSIAINFNKNKIISPSSINSATVSSVQIINNQLVINGNGFNDVTKVKVDGTAFSENFSIESKSATKIIANSIRAFSFDVSKVFNVILSDANASATFPIDFSLCNATLNGKGFDCAAPITDKDVLSYDAVSGKWKPRAVSGLNYLGAFNASSNPATGPATQPAGAYYIISASGAIAGIPFTIGDWLVSNGSAWQKIDNSTAVLSVFGRNGVVTAQTGDYTLDMLGDISFPTAPVAGKVLKFDGTHWVAGDDLSGGGAGSVNTTEIADGAVTDAKIASLSTSKLTGTISSAQITDGTIVNADINAAAAIDYSKLNIPNTTIPYAKLNIADGDIPAAKISGLPVLSSILAATITNGDTTHAPTGEAVYEALQLKLGTSGGTLSVGTISGVPTPIGPSDVVNKAYVNSEDALRLLKAGDTMTGALTLDSDLKVKGGANYVTIKGSASSTAYDLTLPANKGTSGYVLATDGNGVTSWIDVTFSEANVLGTDLAGLNTGVNGPITAADTVLGAFGKMQYQVTDLKAKGQWDKTVNDISYSAGNVSIDKKLRLKSDNANYVEMLSPNALASTYTLTLPANDGNANQVLKTDGAGVLAWVDVNDASVQAFAKSALPTCAAGEVLKSNGTTFSCITDNTGAGAFSGTANRAVITTAGGALGVSATTSTELGYVSGVTSAIQTQIDSKQAALGFTPINKAGDTISSGTFTFSGTSALRAADPIAATDVVNKQYFETFGQWTKSGSDIYRSAGNVGIATSTPGMPLTVNGTSLIGAATTTYTGTSYNATIIGNTALGPHMIFDGGATSLMRMLWNTNALSFSKCASTNCSSSTPIMGLDTVNNYFTIGNGFKIGVGVSAPAHDITFRTGGARSIGFERNSSTQTDFTINAGSTSVGFTNGEGGNLILKSGISTGTGDSDIKFFTTPPGASGTADNISTQRMLISSTGNVGIGTTNPQSILDVNGSVRIAMDATTCSGTIAGAMRFNTPNVEFCNGTTWAAFGTSNAAVASSQITDGTIVDADINNAANITATKLGTGVVDNTEFSYLNGVTSSIQTQLNAKQATDTTLTALAGYNSNGILVQTTADTFVGRSIAGTANRLTVTNGDGVSGNPTLNIPTALLPSPGAGDIGKFLKATAADTSVWTALGLSDVTTALGFTPINKAGDTLTTGTFTLSGAAVLRTPNPIAPTDVANKQYVDGVTYWTPTGSDIYRASGNVGIGIAAPATPLHVSGSALIGAGNTTFTNYSNYVLGGSNSITNTGGGNAGAMTVVGTSNTFTTSLMNFSYNTAVFGVSNTLGNAGNALVVGRSNNLTASNALVVGNSNTSSASSAHIIGTGITNSVASSLMVGSGDTAKFTMLASNGSIGVGTNTPISSFNVNRTLPTGTISSSGTTVTGSGTNFTTAFVVGDEFVAAGQAKKVVTLTSATSMVVNTTFSSDLPAGTEYTRTGVLLNAGNVGINTLIPVAQLDLGSSFYTGTPTTLAQLNNKHSLWTASGIPYYGFGVSTAALNITAGEAAGTIRFHTGGPNERMRISSTGNVGIGTTAPASKLHVNGGRLQIDSVASNWFQIGADATANSFGGFFKGGTTTSVGYIGTDGGGISSAGAGNNFGIRAENDLILMAGSTERMRVAAGGGLGIGTSAPGSILHLASAAPYVTFEETDVAQKFFTGVDGYGYFIRQGTTANPDLFTVKNTGLIGIGMTTPSYTLHVNGSVAGTGAYNSLSDARLKKDIKTIPNSLEKISGLRGVSFNWNKEAHPELKLNDRGELGVIAQEVQKVFPDAVTVDKKTGILSVAYSMLIAPLIEAVKSLNKMVAEIFTTTHENSREIASVKAESALKDERIKKLEKENLEMKARLDKIEKMLK